MEENKEFKLLKETCKDNVNKYRLIKELLKIQRNKALMNRRRGLNVEVENKIESYIKRKLL